VVIHQQPSDFGSGLPQLHLKAAHSQQADLLILIRNLFLHNLWVQMLALWPKWPIELLLILESSQTNARKDEVIIQAPRGYIFILRHPSQQILLKDLTLHSKRYPFKKPPSEMMM
jgi:hypothetical protein